MIKKNFATSQLNNTNFSNTFYFDIMRKNKKKFSMKLPLGIQTFSQIREEDYIYIDKTAQASELINTYKYVFLSRPRSFGKSLFVDTLANIFEGKKEYFKGLYIEDKYDFSDTYPVIRVSFSGQLKTENGLYQAMLDVVRYNEYILDIKCNKSQNPSSCFKTLILQAYEKYKKPAVILIDEYDKPLLDNITDEQMAKHARAELKSFYEVMKEKDKYIKFVFITGVSKFSKVSLFSGLNNLTDITLNPDYGSICGYTQNDIEVDFKPLLKGVDLEKLKLWYNGYNFLGDKVYNPYGILLFCDSHHIYENYWFDTATPTFLIELMKKNNYYLPNIENITLSKDILNSFEIENIDIEVLLFQTGYLTIKEVLTGFDGSIEYSLTLPNREVTLSFYKSIIYSFYGDNRSKKRENIYKSLINAKLDDFKSSLTTLFASIPHENYKKDKLQNYEGHYASVIYVYLASLGLPISAKESTNQGTLDLTILANKNRYIFEFKVGNKNALQQIKEKKYYEKYLDEGSKIYLVGINFDKDKRNVSEVEWEEV